MLYLLFKFIHVLAVIIWLGGVIMMTLLNARISGAENPVALRALMGEASRIGPRVIGIAAATSLLTGIGATVSGGIPFKSLWISLGFLAVIVSIALGASLIRITTNKLTALVNEDASDTATVTALQGRLRLVNSLNILILIGAVAAMVFKPLL